MKGFYREKLQVNHFWEFKRLGPLGDLLVKVLYLWGWALIWGWELIKIFTIFWKYSGKFTLQQSTKL